MPTLSFKELIAEAKRTDSFWVEKAILDFTEDLYVLMQRCGINKKELAERLGHSPAYITKILRGNANFTIESMVKLSRALEGNLHLHVTEKDKEVRWFDLFYNKKHNKFFAADKVIRRSRSIAFIPQVTTEGNNETDESPIAA